MKTIYIEFDIIYGIGAVITLICIILFAGLIGYVKGIKKAERQFLDKFVHDS